MQKEMDAGGYDVVTIGETMLRLTPPNQLRIRQAKQFDIEVGGTESNTAVGLVQLGLKVTWVSRLPCNPVGELVTQTLTSYGVDCSHVCWADDERLGIYFFEDGAAPRGSRVIYDRQNSALSRMKTADLPLTLFQPQKASLLHVTGITPALSRDVADALQTAVSHAQQANWLISFDLNYRSKLWSPSEARKGCEPFVQSAHIFLLPLRDAVLIYGVEAEAKTAVRTLAQQYPDTLIVLTLGSDGAIAYDPETDQVVRQASFPVETQIGRLGGGDAFDAGFLYGYLTSKTERVVNALRWGAATASIKYTIPGDMPLVEKTEVEALFQADSDGGVQR